VVRKGKPFAFFEGLDQLYLQASSSESPFESPIRSDRFRQRELGNPPELLTVDLGDERARRAQPVRRFPEHLLQEPAGLGSFMLNLLLFFLRLRYDVSWAVAVNLYGTVTTDLSITPLWKSTCLLGKASSMRTLVCSGDCSVASRSNSSLGIFSTGKSSLGMSVSPDNICSRRTATGQQDDWVPAEITSLLILPCTPRKKKPAPGCLLLSTLVP
jgi:hypothetical protein